MVWWLAYSTTSQKVLALTTIDSSRVCGCVLQTNHRLFSSRLYKISRDGGSSQSITSMRLLATIIYAWASLPKDLTDQVDPSRSVYARPIVFLLISYHLFELDYTRNGVLNLPLGESPALFYRSYFMAYFNENLLTC